MAEPKKKRKNLDPRIFTDVSLGGDQVVSLHSRARIPQRGISVRGDNVEQKINTYVDENNKRVLLQFPHERPKYYFMISFQKYNRQNFFDVEAKLNTTDTIILPLPLDIKDSHAVAYDENTALGIAGGNLLNQGMQLGEKSIEDVTKSFTDVSQGWKKGAPLDENLKVAREKTAQGLALGGSLLGGVGSSISDALQFMYGFSPNQFFTVLLRGPTYKRFNLAWHLIPKTFEEARTIRNIVMTLNNAMSPGLGVDGAIFTFPQVARMAFFPNFDFLYKFKPCVITGIDIDYNDRQGTAFYHDPIPSQGTGAARGLAGQNPPESVRIVIECLELEYWLKGDFQINKAADITTGPRGE